MKVKEFYRVITPITFADLSTHEVKGMDYLNRTIDDAKLTIEQFGKCSDPKYKEYWDKQKKLCKIEHVVEISNLIEES